MTQWHYTSPDGQPIGPVDEPALVALHHDGRVSAQTLVWREGMPEWRPWGEISAGILAAYTSTDAAPVAAPPVPVAPPAPPAPSSTRVSQPAPVHGAPVVHAGFWKRLAAAIIDGLILACVSCVLVAPLSAIFDASGTLLSSISENPLTAAMQFGSSLTSGLLSLLPACLYHGWLTSTPMQASLGKVAVGIKVVRRDGAPLDFWRGFLRQLANSGIVLASCGISLIVNAVMVGMHDRKQAVHDLLCDTVVVDKYAFTHEHGRQQTMIGPVALAVLMVFGLLAVGGCVMLGISLAALIENYR